MSYASLAPEYVYRKTWYELHSRIDILMFRDWLMADKTFLLPNEYFFSTTCKIFKLIHRLCGYIYLQIRLLYGIKSNAAISLPFNLHCKSIAALFFTQYWCPIWGCCRLCMVSYWYIRDSEYQSFSGIKPPLLVHIWIT